MKTAEDYWDDFDVAIKDMQEALRKASENAKELKEVLLDLKDTPSVN